jgi:hypothetical protein
MSNEPLAIQLARVAVSMEYIQKELEDAKQARKGQYEKMEEQNVTLMKLDGRMSEVEKSLRTQAPTIEEFITIKQRVVGAGVAGRWSWAALTGVIALLCTFRTEIFRWLSR